MNKIFDEVAGVLQSKHSIMFEFASTMVEPRFDESIPTACVIFEPTSGERNVGFLFNPDFWESLNFQERVFVFIHEVLHVLLFHGSRGIEFLKSLPKEQQNHRLLNVAMDICINEIILEQYTNLPRAAFPTLMNFPICLIDTVFEKDASKIRKHQSFPYYYMELLKCENLSEAASFDDHSFLEIDKEQIEEIEKMIGDSIRGFDDHVQPENDKVKSPSFSTEAQPDTNKTEIIPTAPEQKLEHHLNIMIASKFGGKEPKPKYKRQWYGTNRRTPSFSSGMIMPTVHERKKKNQAKHHIVCYCDTSGSVARHSNKFMNLISGLDFGKFDLDLYVWANYVKPVKIDDKNKLNVPYAGGGTDIHAVLNHFRSHYKSKLPDATIVLTDGAYNSIRNKHYAYYKDWTFFFTEYSSNFPELANSVQIFQ